MILTLLFLILCHQLSAIPVNSQPFSTQPFEITGEDLSFDVFTGVAFNYDIQITKASIGVMPVESLDSSQIITDPQAYFTPDNCKFTPSQVTLAEQHTLLRSSTVIKASIREESHVYSIVGDNLIILAYYYTSKGMIIQNIYNKTMDHPSFALSQSRFFSLNKKVYLTDGNTLFLIDLDRSGSQLQVQILIVFGFQRPKIEEKLIKIDTNNQSNSIIFLTSKALYSYQFKDQIHCNMVKFSNIDFSQNVFVDVAYNASSIYLLDISKGLFIMPNNFSAAPSQQQLPITQHKLKFKKMEIISNTIEIVFEFAKEIYVVELIYHQGALHINRYYDEISGFKDIDFANERAFFIGEDEILLVPHSIPTTTLLEIKRLPKQFYYSYGMNYFDVIHSLSSDRQLVLFGYNDYELMIVHFDTSPSRLTCNIDNDATLRQRVFLISMNFTGFPKLNTGEFVTYNQFIKLNIVTPVGQKFNIVIIVLTVLLVMVAIFVAIIVAIRFKGRRKVIMEAIGKKIDELRSSVSTDKLKV